jgi:DNA-binding NarL/FixJ family response regulator
MNSQEEIRVFIIEDHEIVRGMLRKLIEQTTGLMVCGQAASAEEALPQFAAVRPEVILVDLSLPGMDGLDFIKEITRIEPTIKTLAVSAHLESIYAQRALEAGACGYVTKDDLVEAGPAVHHVYAGNFYFSDKIQENMDN